MKMSHVGFAGMILSVASLSMAQAPATDATAEPAAAPAPVAAAAPAKKLRYTDDYRIAVNRDADSDGENVIIERSMGNEDISLVLVSSTVKGVTVKVHRD